MITLDGVTKRYGDGPTVVDDLSLTAPQGKITVLVGPSGCGKTTTLRMVNRMVERTSGTITIDGRDVPYLATARACAALATTLHLPATVVPVGLTSTARRLPVGLQIVGPYLADRTTLHEHGVEALAHGREGMGDRDEHRVHAHPDGPVAVALGHGHELHDVTGARGVRDVVGRDDRSPVFGVIVSHPAHGVHVEREAVSAARGDRELGV